MNCHRMKTWCLHVKFDDIPKTFGDSDDVQDNTMIMMTMMPAVWTVRGGQWLNAYVWCMLMSYRSVNSDLRFKITREIYCKRKICKIFSGILNVKACIICERKCSLKENKMNMAQYG